MKLSVIQIMHFNKACDELAEFAYDVIEKKRVEGSGKVEILTKLQRLTAAIETIQRMATALTSAEVSVKG